MLLPEIPEIAVWAIYLAPLASFVVIGAALRNRPLHAGRLTIAAVGLSWLLALWALAGNSDVLSTFNGKSFDWPCVHDRSTLHHLGRDDRYVARCDDSTAVIPISLTEAMHAGMRRPNMVHCDLLHHSRRKWKNALPNCRLQTLERYVCGRRRYDDIPGSAIPAAYHQFVRTNDAWEMRSILHHNALDLITLLQLSIRVVE